MRIPKYIDEALRKRANAAFRFRQYDDVDYIVHRGDKISQLVVVKIDTPELVLVEKLADTERGNGGFGSTGR